MFQEPRWTPKTWKGGSAQQGAVLFLFEIMRLWKVHIKREQKQEPPLVEREQLLTVDRLMDTLFKRWYSEADHDAILELFEPPEYMTYIRQGLHELVNSGHGRMMCVTDAGRVCNGMNEVQKGDVIVALQGADRLYVLRPANNRYRLVGDAFVVGLMDGEAYEGLNPDESDGEIEIF